MSCSVASGNVTELLSIITGANKSEIETLLLSGITPWVVAAKYGKYSEFKEMIKENYLDRLNKLVENNELSASEAIEMYEKISSF